MPDRFKRADNQREVRAHSSSASQLEAAMQQSLHLRRIGSGICPANPFACDVAGEFMQFQSDCQSLLARHLTVTVNLFFQGGSRIHNLSIVYLRFADNCRNQPKIEKGGDNK